MVVFDPNPLDNFHQGNFTQHENTFRNTFRGQNNIVTTSRLNSQGRWPKASALVGISFGSPQFPFFAHETFRILTQNLIFSKNCHFLLIFRTSYFVFFAPETFTIWSQNRSAGYRQNDRSPLVFDGNMGNVQIALEIQYLPNRQKSHRNRDKLTHKDFQTPTFTQQALRAIIKKPADKVVRLSAASGSSVSSDQDSETTFPTISSILFLCEKSAMSYNVMQFVGIKKMK